MEVDNYLLQFNTVSANVADAFVGKDHKTTPEQNPVSFILSDMRKIATSRGPDNISSTRL